MTASVVVSVLLGGFTVAASQLPPEIMADRLLVQAERQIGNGDYAAAVATLDRILALQTEHDLEIPGAFWFKHAQVSLEAGLHSQAVESATRYLQAVGQEGEHYREALELLVEAEQLQTRGDAPKCEGQPEGAACGMELSYPPECYLWNPNLQTDDTATWTGECSGGWARGTGTLTWGTGEDKKVHTGRIQAGKMHGDWVWRDENGNVGEGTYVEGKRHGLWVTRSPERTERESDGTERREDGTVVEEGIYVDGKKHGHWVIRTPKATVRSPERTERREDGTERRVGGQVEEGPYVNGKKHGQWVWYRENGKVYEEGTYVEGKKHGLWVTRWSVGGGEEGPYVEGKKHGLWVTRWSVGGRSKGPYVNGKKHGQWVRYRENGKVYGKEPYVNGKKHGQWVWYRENGKVYGKETYVEGKKHGQWVRYRENGKVYEEGTYVEGKKHGQWVRYYRKGARKFTYENGKRVNN